MTNPNSFELWADAYWREKEHNDQVSAPAETIVRLFKGDDDAQAGRIYDTLFTATVDGFVVTGVKP